MKLLLILLCISQIANGAVSDGNSGDVMTTDGAGVFTWEPVPPPTVFTPGAETYFTEAGDTNIDDGDYATIYPAVVTRSNVSLGSSADIISRTSDTQVKIVNAGLHCVSISFATERQAKWQFLINGVEWDTYMLKHKDNDESHVLFTITYNFTADDEIRVRIISAPNPLDTEDIMLSVTRITE